MYKSLSIAVVFSVFLTLNNTVFAKSQCSGLSHSVCSSSNTCTWRKSSVDKNGKKTKAHCRALPGQAKSVIKTQSSINSTNAKATATKTNSLKVKTKSNTKKTTATTSKSTQNKAKASKAKASKAKASKAKVKKTKKTSS